MSEKLIKFPVSEWMTKSNNFKNSLPLSAYCICYQYDINENGYGPYGFSTIKAKELLSFLFTNLMFYNKEEKNLTVCSIPGKRGVYFYGDSSNRINKQMQEYKKMILKNELRVNKGLTEETYSEIPDLSKLYNEHEIEVSIINKIIDEGYDLFFNCFFTPIAGQSLIVFDDNVWSRATEYCENNEIFFQVTDLTDNLKEW
ncbi:TPA: hypothetical protein M4K80_004457 [Salmonella enterica]|nr:hypothetical protein [Salmonella enterica]